MNAQNAVLAQTFVRLRQSAFLNGNVNYMHIGSPGEGLPIFCGKPLPNPPPNGEGAPSGGKPLTSLPSHRRGEGQGVGRQKQSA